MSKIPEKYICDIEGCSETCSTTSTGKRNYVSAHVALLTEETEDRLNTLKNPVLDLQELDLCDKHFKMYVNNLPIVGKHDGRRGIDFSFKGQK